MISTVSVPRKFFMWLLCLSSEGDPGSFVFHCVPYQWQLSSGFVLDETYIQCPEHLLHQPF